MLFQTQLSKVKIIQDFADHKGRLDLPTSFLLRGDVLSFSSAV